MTPKERQKLNELQRQLVGEMQLADKLYAALVHGGFDHIWWAMQDYAEARGIKGKQPQKMKPASRMPVILHSPSGTGLPGNP